MQTNLKKRKNNENLQIFGYSLHFFPSFEDNAFIKKGAVKWKSRQALWMALYLCATLVNLRSLLLFWASFSKSFPNIWLSETLETTFFLLTNKNCAYSSFFPYVFESHFLKCILEVCVTQVEKFEYSIWRTCQVPNMFFWICRCCNKHKFKEKSKVKREKKWILPMVLIPTDTDLLCDYVSMVFFLFRLKKQISRKKCIVDRRQAGTLHTSSWDFEFRLKIAIWSDFFVGSFAIYIEYSKFEFQPIDLYEFDMCVNCAFRGIWIEWWLQFNSKKGKNRFQKIFHNFFVEFFFLCRKLAV